MLTACLSVFLVWVLHCQNKNKRVLTITKIEGIKKLLVVIILFVIGLPSYAYDGMGYGKKENADKSKTKDETAFEMNLEKEANKLEVTIEGTFDRYASISITSQRGKELAFEFVKPGVSNYEFDISNLQSGNYFLVLSCKKEIRLKRFLKK